jgi:hypothetical protein
LATVRWSLPSQNGTAPAAGDTLLLHFNVPLQTRPVETQATLDALIVFTPPIKNVTYVGRFVAHGCELSLSRRCNTAEVLLRQVGVLVYS